MTNQKVRNGPRRAYRFFGGFFQTTFKDDYISEYHLTCNTVPVLIKRACNTHVEF